MDVGGFRRLELALHGPIVPFVSMRPKRPTPKTVPCTPGGRRRQDSTRVDGDAHDNDEGTPRTTLSSFLLLTLGRGTVDPSEFPRYAAVGRLETSECLNFLRHELSLSRRASSV